MTKPSTTPNKASANQATKRLKRAQAATAVRETPTPETSTPEAPKAVPPESSVLRDRAAPHERAFVDGKRSSDPLAEEMAEDAVRAMTSGEDETAAERGDAVNPALKNLVGSDAAITEDDPDEMTTGEFDRAQQPV